MSYALTDHEGKPGQRPGVIEPGVTTFTRLDGFSSEVGLPVISKVFGNACCES